MFRYLLSADPASAGVGGGATPPPPAAPPPPVPQNLTPVAAPAPAAPPPPPAAPPAAQPASPGADPVAAIRALLDEKLKPVSDLDNKVGMLVKTTLYELGFRPPEKDKRGPGRPPTRQEPASNAPAPAAPQPGAPPAAPQSPAAPPPPAGGSSLEAEALRTQLAEMQAQIESANKQLAEAKIKEERAAVESHLSQVRGQAEKILTSSSIGMVPDSAAQAARMLMDLDKAIQEDNEGNLFLKYKDDNGKEVTKPLLEGLQAWSNTRAGRVFKPAPPQGSGVGQFVRDKLQSLGRAPVNPQQNYQNNFASAWQQQKAGIVK